MSGRGDGTIIAPAPRPRSGLGLNELLARRSAFGVEQNSGVFVLHTPWCRKPQELSPGVGHNPRVMAGAWARVGQRSSCWALCRCCGSAGLTPELSRADERPRRWDDHSASAEAAKRTRLERIVRPQTCFCALSQRCPPEALVAVWNFHTQQLSPGAGHNPRVMAGAWARAGQGSSCRALCRCCGSAGLTPELSRLA